MEVGFRNLSLLFIIINMEFLVIKKMRTRYIHYCLLQMWTVRRELFCYLFIIYVAVLWILTPYSLLDGYQQIGGTIKENVFSLRNI